MTSFDLKGYYFENAYIIEILHPVFWRLRVSLGNGTLQRLLLERLDQVYVKTKKGDNGRISIPYGSFAAPKSY